MTFGCNCLIIALSFAALSFTQPVVTKVTGPEAIRQMCSAAPSGRLCFAFNPYLEGVSGLRDYETVIIWSSSIPEVDLEKEHDHVVEIIKGNKGEYKGSDKWGRRMLAYPIKKQTEGIYHFIKWNGETDIIGSIDKHLKIHEGCIRYATLRLDDEAVPSVNSFDDFDSGDKEVNVNNGSEDA